MKEIRFKGHSLKEWVLATRPWSFPNSTMPVVVTTAFLFWKGAAINLWFALLAFVGMCLFQAAGNVLSDIYDFRSRVDDDDTLGSKSLTSGQFTVGEFWWLSVGLLAAAVIIGLALVIYTGPQLLWIGGAGFLLAVFYPFLKFHALGDADIFLTYSFLPALGTSFVTAGGIDWSVLWPAVPYGLMIVGVLHVNNARDITTDRRAGIRTFAMLLGVRGSIAVYCFEVLFPFVWVIGCIVAGIFPVWTLLAFAVIVRAWKQSRQMMTFETGGMKAIENLDQQTASLQLKFSLLFSIGFVIAALI